MWRCNRALLTVVLGLLLMATGGAQQKPVDSTFRCEEGLRVWMQYVSLPSSENALAVWRSIPKCGFGNWTTDSICRELNDSVYEYMGILEMQIRCADSNAVILGFRLLSTSDGELREWLDMTLGSVIRVNPHLFLIGLSTVWSCGPGIGGLVGNLGDAYVDRFDAQEYETSMRANALRSVDDPALRELRDTCIAELTGHR